MAGAHVRYSPPRLINPMVIGNENAALSLDSVEVGHDVLMCCGFESDGAVLESDASIGGLLDCGAGRFLNSNGLALGVGETIIKGSVFLAQNPYGYAGNFAADGVVFFSKAQVGGSFFVLHAKFAGKAAEAHGFVADLLNVQGAFVWQDVDLENGALLDLSGASVGGLHDEERSWPQPGKLMIDNFTYAFGSGLLFGQVPVESPRDARSRLRWLGLQNGYHLQPLSATCQSAARDSNPHGGSPTREF